jgi:hypothetical protein
VCDEVTVSSCRVCQSNEGRARISPGEPIYEGDHWVVEHAYPLSAAQAWHGMGWVGVTMRRRMA